MSGRSTSSALAVHGEVTACNAFPSCALSGPAPCLESPSGDGPSAAATQRGEVVSCVPCCIPRAGGAWGGSEGCQVRGEEHRGNGGRQEALRQTQS